MDPSHQVIWTSVAENDLKAMIQYIAVNNPQNALKILHKGIDRGRMNHLNLNHIC